MKIERRKFLRSVAGICASGTGVKLATDLLATQSAAYGFVEAHVAASTAAAATSAAVSTYGSGVRTQVFEVIVRQAMRGTPWQTICAGPMQVNKIGVEEIEAEVARRTQARNNFVERRKAIPHSVQAPCACASCCEEVTAILQKLQKSVDYDESFDLT